MDILKYTRPRSGSQCSWHMAFMISLSTTMTRNYYHQLLSTKADFTTALVSLSSSQLRASSTLWIGCKSTTCKFTFCSDTCVSAKLHFFLWKLFTQVNSAMTLTTFWCHTGAEKAVKICRQSWQHFTRRYLVQWPANVCINNLHIN